LVYVIGEMTESRQWGKTSTFGPRQWFRQRLMLKELKKYLPQGKVLDAGCGEGRMLRLLAEKGYQVVGMDLSRESLLRAQKQNPNAPLVLSDLESLPFSPESFDGVISGEVLEHLEDDERAVQEFHRVLKKGGIAIITVPAHPELWSLDDQWSGHKRRYKKEELEKLFEKNHFQTLSCYYWGFPLLRIYYQFFYPRWLKKKLQKEDINKVSGFQPQKKFEFIFNFALCLDQLFLGKSGGIGIIGIFYRV